MDAIHTEIAVPPSPGTYLLVARLDRDAELRVGRLGTWAFPVGWYAYAGSAMGPGGLRARLARHWRTDKRLHWHIDFLLERAVLVQSWYVASPVHLECAWAAAVRRLPASETLVLGFGSSDCRCPAHLVYWPQEPVQSQLLDALRAASSTSCVLRAAPYQAVQPNG